MTGDQLKELRQQSNLTQEELAERIGVSARWIIKLESGEKGISRDVLQKIQAVFKPEQPARPQYLIPLFDQDLSNTTMEFFENPQEFPHVDIDLPGYRGAKFAISIAGDAMYPSISSGSLVICKEITDKSLIMYGEIYLIVTADYRIVKRVKKSNKKGYIIAVSDNHNGHSDPDGKTYANVDIPIEKIKFLYLVTGSIKRHQI
jgi:transcriptional regulator with XRE-family HTH domain